MMETLSSELDVPNVKSMTVFEGMERLSSELGPVRSKEPNRTNTRAQLVVKDELLWKELQRELASSHVITSVGVQEVTRKFMEDKAQWLEATEERMKSPTVSQRKHLRGRSLQFPYRKGFFTGMKSGDEEHRRSASLNENETVLGSRISPAENSSAERTDVIPMSVVHDVLKTAMSIDVSLPEEACNSKTMHGLPSIQEKGWSLTEAARLPPVAESHPNITFFDEDHELSEDCGRQSEEKDVDAMAPQNTHSGASVLKDRLSRFMYAADFIKGDLAAETVPLEERGRAA